MGAVKRFYEECAEAGLCPVGPETLDYLDGLEVADTTLDWIAYCEHDYRAINGLLVSQECIRLHSARRLVAEGLANDEIAMFVECFGDYCPA